MRGAGSRAGIAAEPFTAISAPVPGPNSPVFNLNLLSLPLQHATMCPVAAINNVWRGNSQGMDSKKARLFAFKGPIG